MTGSQQGEASVVITEQSQAVTVAHEHDKFSQESRSLYVGHLPDGVVYYDLCKAAHDFGPLELVKLVPKKKCAFLNFVNLEDAKKMMSAFSSSAVPHPEDAEEQENVLRIMNKAVRLSWSDTRPLPQELRTAVDEQGASRNLFVFYGNCVRPVGQLNPSGSNVVPVVTASELADKFRRFGNIENIVMKPKNHIAFVNMTSLASAMNIVKSSVEGESKDEYEVNLKGLLLRGGKLVVKYSTEAKSGENYARERNDPRNQPFSYNGEYLHPKQVSSSQRQGVLNGVNIGVYNSRSALTLPEPELPEGWMESVDEVSGCKYYYNLEQKISQWEHPVTRKPFLPKAEVRGSLYREVDLQLEMSHMSLSRPSRAVVLQNLPPNVNYAMLCTLARQHGMIESVRLLPEKLMAFINYVDPSSAVNLFNYGQSQPIKMDGYLLKIGCAKDVPIKHFLYEAIVQNGANRSVYLRDLDGTFTEEEISQKFLQVTNGVIESIILRPQNKPFGFVNFTDIISAKKIVDAGKKNGGNFEFGDGRSVHVSYVNHRKPVGGHHTYENSAHAGNLRTTVTNKNSRGGCNEVPCRSVILSQFPKDTTYNDITALGSTFGSIESLHLNRVKNHAFINFVNPESAKSFMETAESAGGFEIKGQILRTGFGKSVPINGKILSAISSEGASRTAFVGGIQGSEAE